MSEENHPILSDKDWEAWERLQEARYEEEYHERRYAEKMKGGDTMNTIQEDGKPKYCADCKHDNTGENRTTHGATCNHPDAMNDDFFARAGYWCFVAKGAV